MSQITSERSLYGASENYLRDRELALVGNLGFDIEAYSFLDDYFRSMYQVKPSSGRIRRKSRKSNNKQDYYNHIRRMCVRSLEMGAKSPLLLFSHKLHDSPEIKVSLGLTPEKALEVFYNELETIEEVLSDFKIMPGDLFNLGLLSTRPFVKNSNGKWVEDKGNSSFFNRFTPNSNFVEAFGDEVNPNEYNGFHTLVKGMDKIDIIDSYMKYKVPRKKQKRQLYEGSIMIECLKMLKNPQKKQLKGYHPDYTLANLSKDYPRQVENGLTRKIEELSVRVPGSEILIEKGRHYAKLYLE